MRISSSRTIKPPKRVEPKAPNPGDDHRSPEMIEAIEALTPLSRQGWRVTATPHQVEFAGAMATVTLIEHGRRVSCEIGLAKPLTSADSAQSKRELTAALTFTRCVFPGLDSLCTVLTDIARADLVKAA